MIRSLVTSALRCGRRTGAVCLLLLLSGCQGALIATPTPQADETQGAAVTVEAIEPAPAEQALRPTRLEIPELDLAVEVTPMGWVVEDVNGVRTTRWQVPETAAGWHITSVGAGGAGRTILSGHQVMGSAPFAPLAQGQVQPGHTILLTDSEGTVFVYQVVEITDPIPLTGASPEDEALAMSYLEPSSEPLLTLITGWPDFTTTHRIFALAEFAGVQSP